MMNNSKPFRAGAPGNQAPVVKYVLPPKMQPHPVNPDRKCKNCHFWLKDSAKLCAHVEGVGPVSTGDLIKSGARLPTSEETMLISHCTRLPIWAQTTDDHWCAIWSQD